MKNETEVGRKNATQKIYSGCIVDASIIEQHLVDQINLEIEKLKVAIELSEKVKSGVILTILHRNLDYLRVMTAKNNSNIELFWFNSLSDSEQYEYISSYADCNVATIYNIVLERIITQKNDFIKTYIGDFEKPANYKSKLIEFDRKINKMKSPRF